MSPAAAGSTALHLAARGGELHVALVVLRHHVSVLGARGGGEQGQGWKARERASPEHVGLDRRTCDGSAPIGGAHASLTS